MSEQSRRSLLIGSAAVGSALAASQVRSETPQVAAAAAAPAPPVAPPPTPPRTVPSELMMYCTVRLTFANSAGTGFIFPFFNYNGRSYYGIVSNRHVFEQPPEVQGECKNVMDADCVLYDEGYFSLTMQKADGTPDIGNVEVIHMTDIRRRLIVHPSVDLVVYLISDAVNELISKGKKPYVVPITADIIPTDDQWAKFTPLENIVTVGYPGLMWDNVNVLPLFHSGRTATPVYIDFKGKSEFLVDTATWPGASGSPVFIYDQGTIFDPRTGAVTFGERTYLVGVVYGVAEQEVDGSVIIVDAPTHTFSRTAYTAAMPVPTNLGACIRSTRVLEFEPILARMGIPVPSGYKMRAHP